MRALFCASGTPETAKPIPVEAKASAAPGVTSSKACCHAAEICGVTSMPRQRRAVAVRRPRKE